MRRWMAVCIAVLIAFFVSPTVFGAEAEQELFVNDVRVTEANAKDVLGDETVRCSIETAVLSLKGARLRKLSVKGTWTLEVTGENTVREGMTVNGNLTVRGAGCLTVTGGLNLSEGSTILPASGMRVWAGNSQNGGDAFEIENPDKEVYESAYVRFEPDYQTVHYLPDGICTGNEQSGKHYNGMPLILPDKVCFSREGYTQTGWRDAAGGRVYSLGDSVSEGAGTIYYPVWTVNRYTVTFRFGNGGEDLVLTVAYGAALEAPAEPVRIGYRFCGWNLPLPNTMPAQNLIRQALWMRPQRQYNRAVLHDGNGLLGLRRRIGEDSAPRGGGRRRLHNARDLLGLWCCPCQSVRRASASGMEAFARRQTFPRLRQQRLRLYGIRADSAVGVCRTARRRNLRS